MIRTKAVSLAKDAEGSLARTPQNLTVIPYYAWANRGRGQMIVWLPDSEASATPTMPPGVTTGAKITTDGKKQIQPVNADEEPSASNDHSMYFDWWADQRAGANRVDGVRICEAADSSRIESLLV